MKNKTVVLSGGLGLIGKAFAQTLADNNARVHIIDLVDQESANQIIQDNFSSTQQNQITYHLADITQKEQLLAVRESILASDKKIDVLINNAALNPKVEKGNQVTSSNTTFEDMAIEQWNREIAVNLTGTMLCCQVFGSVMQSGASIINIASIYGLVAPDQSIYPAGFFKPAAYGVTKAGVINLTKYLAGYWGSKNVRVNCLVLGGVENSQDPDFIKKYSSKTPLHRMATVADYQGAIRYFSSDDSSYATGSVLVIDGGWTAL